MLMSATGSLRTCRSIWLQLHSQARRGSFLYPHGQGRASKVFPRPSSKATARSIVLPQLGGPTKRIEWSPAAATSKARFAISFP